MTVALKTRNQVLASQLNNILNERIEEQLRQEVSRFFKTLGDKVLAAFDEYYNENLLLQGQVDLILAPIHEANKDYYDLLLARNVEMFQRGALQAERIVDRMVKSSLKAAKPVQFKHDDEDKYTQHFGTIKYTEDYLQDYTFEATEKTLGRVDEEINNILTTGYQEGWGVKDVRNRIMERYSQFEDWEANRIARTEMHTAHNMGMMNGYASQGVEYIQWRSAHDKRVRGTKKTDLANHVKMNGEIIRLGDLFSNGLAFPGDKGGPIYEWINCRCSAVPFLMPYGMMAPPGMVQFRESDLVSFDAPDVNELLKKHTGGALDWEHVQQYIRTGDLGMISSGVSTHREEEEEEPSETPTAPPIEQSITLNDSHMLKGEYEHYTEVDPTNKSKVNVYRYENGFEIAINENSLISFEEVVSHIKTLPIELQTMDALDRIVVRDWHAKRKGGHFSPSDKEVVVFQSAGSKARHFEVLNHELAHAYDHKMGGADLNVYGCSKVEMYDNIFKKDNAHQHTIHGGKGRVKNVFVTDYAARSFIKYKKNYRRIIKQLKKSPNLDITPHDFRYGEDFAESFALYFDPLKHDKFVKDFPNRSKYLESLFGKPKFDKNSVYYKELIKLQKEQEQRVREQEALNKAEEKWEKLTDKQKDKELEKVLGSKERVKAFHRMEEKYLKLKVVPIAISAQEIDVLIQNGWDRSTAKDIMKNPNDYLPKVNEEKRKLKAILNQTKDLVKKQL